MTDNPEITRNNLPDALRQLRDTHGADQITITITAAGVQDLANDLEFAKDNRQGMRTYGPIRLAGRIL